MNDEDRKRIGEHSRQLSEQATKLSELVKKDLHLQHQIDGLYLIAEANNTSIAGLIESSRNLLASVAELRQTVADYIRAVRNGKATN